MNKLMRFEFRKLLRSKYLYVILIVAISFLMISGLTTKVLSDFFADETGGPGVEIYPFVKGALGGTFKTILGVFVAIFACEDSSQGTDKNVLAKGYNKVQVFFSKYLVSMIATIMIGLVMILTAYLFGLALFVNGEVTENLFVVFSGQFLGLMTIHALFFSIAYFFAKIGPAIAINMAEDVNIQAFVCTMMQMLNI